MTVDPEAFGRNLKRILKEKKLTQKQFAGESGLSYRSIGGWCNGVLPCADSLAIICHALEIPADVLLEGIIE